MFSESQETLAVILLTLLAAIVLFGVGGAAQYEGEKSAARRITTAWCAAEHTGTIQGDVCVASGRAYDVPDWISGEGE